MDAEKFNILATLSVKKTTDGLYISGISYDELVEVFDAARRQIILKPFTVAQTELLVELINGSLDGPEHGITTSDQWKMTLRRLRLLLLSNGYKPNGRWVSLC